MPQALWSIQTKAQHQSPGLVGPADLRFPKATALQMEAVAKNLQQEPALSPLQMPEVEQSLMSASLHRRVMQRLVQEAGQPPHQPALV